MKEAADEKHPAIQASGLGPTPIDPGIKICGLSRLIFAHPYSFVLFLPLEVVSGDRISILAARAGARYWCVQAN